ncbi:hypothetical protein [Streptomyces toxytricini]|uniref:hypothetical protein n=1 Tax=Streptomyces toxytricini TaxID=67369 RepID=UPI0034147CB7
MDFVVEAIFIVLAPCITGNMVRSRSARSAEKRAEAAASGAGTAIPCRVAWKAGIGVPVAVYGRLVGDAAGPAFVPRRHKAVRLPAGGRVSISVHWRPGMQLLRYRAPDGQEIHIVCYDADRAAIVRYLRVPNAAHFD